jgi:hypothetical protein
MWVDYEKEEEQLDHFFTRNQTTTKSHQTKKQKTEILSHIRFFFEIPQKTGPKNKKILKKKEKIVPSYRVIECISL